MSGITIISTKHNRVSKKQGLTKYLYKNVYTKDGRNIGRITQIVFENTTIKGFILARGFLFNKMFIGMEYVDKFTTNSVILKMIPITLLKGMIVFDNEGKIAGTVRNVRRKNNSNSFDSIVVKKGMFGKEYIITPDQMVILKKNIKLNIEIG